MEKFILFEKLPKKQRELNRAKRGSWYGIDPVEDLKSWAEYGDATAQYFLGKLYRDGGLLIPNSKLAADWLYKAACQGVVVAQYALGKLFLSDDFLIRDPKLGMEWLEYAAKNGSHYAAYRMEKSTCTVKS